MNEIFIYGRDVDVQDMLAARDRRAHAQQAWLMRHGTPLISLSMNIAGPRKATPLILSGFEEAVRLVTQQLARHGIAAADFLRVERFTGFEALWAAPCDPLRLKRLMCDIEDADAFGRLLDIDVLRVDGAKISREETGRPARKCLLCGEQALLCARSRAHGLDALIAETNRILTAHLHARFARHVASLAVRALLFEVSVTPKPGLVDRANTGAHNDMDFFSFTNSAAALWPYFYDCAEKGLHAGGKESLFASLRYPGMCAETDMLAATGGVNTHRGAIFSLGILCAAAGYLENAGGEPRSAERLCAACAEMTGDALAAEIAAIDGPAGARGEVAQGFPSVREHGLPAFRRALKEGMPPNDAGVYALVSLMAAVEDANVARRHCVARARTLMQESRALLEQFSLEAARAMDERLIAENISPGGCADLLAVTVFLHEIETYRFA